MIGHDFPYLDIRDINLDWILKRIKELVNGFKTLQENIDYVLNYFNNLDVQDEINNKLDEMLEDGTLEQIIGQYVNQFRGYTTPEMHGAIGDYETDDTAAWQAAINTGKKVICEEGKGYRITGTLELPAGTCIDLSGSSIICEVKHIFENFNKDGVYNAYAGNGNIEIKNGMIQGGCISLFHGRNILIDNIFFYHAINDHFIEICACKNVTVRNCHLQGMQYFEASSLEYINIDPCDYNAFPHLNNPESPSYDNTHCKNLYIQNNILETDAAPFNYMLNGIGSHAAPASDNCHEQIIIEGNIVRGSTNCCFSILGCTRSAIRNNRGSATQSPYRVGYGEFNEIKNNYSEVTQSLIALVNFWFPSENISIIGNISANKGGQDTSGNRVITGQVNGSSFIQLQPHYLGYGSGTTFESALNLNMFNILDVVSGSVGGGTYKRDRMNSYVGRGFQNGEQYTIMCYSSAGVAAPQVVSISGNVLTCPYTLREVYASVDYMRTH